MKRTTRRKLETGTRSLEYCHAHPDTDPGYVTAVANLEALAARAAELAGKQDDGIMQVRTATEKKKTLRRTLTQQHFDHLAWVGLRAAVEAPELERELAVVRVNEQHTHLGFRTVARRMLEDATARKELLEKYGLSPRMLDQIEEVLDQFDAALAESNAGRQQHVGATAELDRVADEIVAAVGVLNGFNRSRFAQDGEALRAWKTASAVITTHPPADETPATPPDTSGTAGAVQPAA